LCVCVCVRVCVCVFITAVPITGIMGGRRSKGGALKRPTNSIKRPTNTIKRGKRRLGSDHLVASCAAVSTVRPHCMHWIAQHARARAHTNTRVDTQTHTWTDRRQRHRRRRQDTQTQTDRHRCMSDEQSWTPPHMTYIYPPPHMTYMYPPPQVGHRETLTGTESAREQEPER
jgi:hypothetical protein